MFYRRHREDTGDSSVMEKLPKEFKEKWIAALRSGKYVQGEGFLYRRFDDDDHSSECYCCLGIACLVAGLTSNDIRNIDVIPNTNAFKTVPKILKGSADDSAAVKHLTGMNDVYDCTFPEIADWIEENL